MVGTKEFYELQDEFEKAMKDLVYGYKIERVKKDDDQPKGHFYYDGTVNQMFHVYMRGYQNGKLTERMY